MSSSRHRWRLLPKPGQVNFDFLPPEFSHLPLALRFEISIIYMCTRVTQTHILFFFFELGQFQGAVCF